MRLAVSTVALVLALATVSGCGGGDDYCDQAADLGKNYANLDFTALDDKQFDALLEDLDSLADSAPDKVEADWRTLHDAAKEYGDIISDAGISFDQLPAVLRGEKVDGVDEDDLKQLQQQLDEYRANTAYPAAAKSLKDNLQSECSLELGGTS